MENQVTIGLKEILILAVCFILYVTAVQVFEGRMEIARQGQLVEQETSFTYEPPTAPVSEDGHTVVIDGIE